MIGSLWGLCCLAQSPGSTDLSFGQHGTLSIDIDQDDHVAKILQDEAGNSYFLGHVAHYGDAADLDFIVGKVTAAGRLDASFGKNGILRGDFGQHHNSRILDADLFEGHLYLIGEGNDLRAQDSQSVYIGKLDLEGSWANEFGTGGIYTRQFLSPYAAAGSIRVLADGRIVYCGMTTDTLAWQIEEPLFGRLLANGMPDSTLGGTGCIAWSLAHGLANLRGAHSDGGVFHTILPMRQGYLLGGVFYTSSYGKAFLMRIDEYGNLDDGFGENGILRPDILPGYTCVVTHAIQREADLLLGATVDIAPRGQDFALIRLDTLGQELDYEGIDFGGQEDRLQSMVLDGNGRLFLAGHTRAEATVLGPESESFAIAAMDDWNDLATDFASAGQLEWTPNPGFGAGANALCTTADHKLLVAGFVQPDASDNFSDILITRLLLDSVDAPAIAPAPMAIYPNPAHDRIAISGLDGQPLSIWDAQGRRVRTAQVSDDEFDIATLAPGLYQLVVGNVQLKLIKQ